MFKKVISVGLISVMMASTACTSTSSGQESYKPAIGGVLGGVGGGVIGNQFGRGSGNIAMTIAGTLIGAAIGHSVGSSLAKSDEMYARQAEQQVYSAPIGQRVSWNNPQTGNGGSYMPTRDGRDNYGNYCREYETVVFIDGRQERAYGTACRDNSGRWNVR